MCPRENPTTNLKRIFVLCTRTRTRSLKIPTVLGTLDGLFLRSAFRPWPLLQGSILETPGPRTRLPTAIPPHCRHGGDRQDPSHNHGGRGRGGGGRINRREYYPRRGQGHALRAPVDSPYHGSSHRTYHEWRGRGGQGSVSVSSFWLCY